MPQNKTIIMLSAKRCGSTAIFKMFQNHPDIGICNINQAIHNWETNFWNYAQRAIDGEPKAFIENLKISSPFLKIKLPVEDEQVFDLWDQIIAKYGPFVFDKSPKYLESLNTFDLLEKYIHKNNDVRFFAFIRDPRDAIYSQYTLWHTHFPKGTPEFREEHWLKYYEHIEILQKRIGPIPLFRYEDFCSAPACYAPILFNFLGVKNYPEAYNHLRPVNVGRYKRTTKLKALKNWQHTDRFQKHIEKYGYDHSFNGIERRGYEIT